MGCDTWVSQFRPPPPTDKVMLMKQMTTATGSPFQYKEHPDGDLIIYAADGDGRLQDKSAIVITPFTMGLVKEAI